LTFNRKSFCFSATHKKTARWSAWAPGCTLLSFAGETFQVSARFKGTGKRKLFHKTNPGLKCETQSKTKGRKNRDGSSKTETRTLAKIEIQTEGATSRERFETENLP
jgi:hypothetical protein